MNIEDSRPVSVTTSTDFVSISADDRVDGPGTRALADAINAALALGSDVRLVVDGCGAAAGGRVVRLSCCAADEGRPHVAAVARGLLRVSRPSSCWTIDVVRRRACRTDAAIDARFILGCHWVPMAELRFAAVAGRVSSSLSDAG